MIVKRVVEYVLEARPPVIVVFRSHIKTVTPSLKRHWDEHNPATSLSDTIDLTYPAFDMKIESAV